MFVFHVVALIICTTTTKLLACFVYEIFLFYFFVFTFKHHVFSSKLKIVVRFYN